MSSEGTREGTRSCVARFARHSKWIACSQAKNLKLRENGHNNSRQCWELLAKNVASVCRGLKVSPVSNFAKQHATGCANGRNM